MEKMLKRSLALILTLVLMIGGMPSFEALATEELIPVTLEVADHTAKAYGNSAASTTGIVLARQSLLVAPNTSALEVITNALGAQNIPYELHSEYRYLSSINGLSEMDCGPQSGWLFSVNNDFSNLGASETLVSSGDHLAIHYSTQGFGVDIGSYWNGSPTLKTLRLGVDEMDVSDHTKLSGSGTKRDPYVISFPVSSSVNTSSLAGSFTSTLHPLYTAFLEESGYVNLSEHRDFSQPVNFALSTIGGFHQTYYRIEVEKARLPLPEYDSDWPSFRGNQNNMGITESKTAKSKEEAYLKWGKKDFDGILGDVTSPILANNSLYVGKGSRVIKLNSETGEVEAQSGLLSGDLNYGMIPLTYGGGMIFVPVGDGRIQALRADTLESLWVSKSMGGQNLTPITYHNGSVYTGTWSKETGLGKYFALQVLDEDPWQETEEKIPAWELEHLGGFYWAGAYATDQYVIFGSDDGTSSHTGESAVLYSVNPVTGEIIDRIENIKGDIRSSIAYDAHTNRLYFTTKAGKLYQVKVNENGTFKQDNINSLDLGGMIAGTPVVHDGLAYVGVSGPGQFSATGNTIKVVDISVPTFKVVAVAETPGYVQSSILLTSGYQQETGKVYAYATYNNLPGGLYMLEVEKTDNKDQDGAAVVNLKHDHLFRPQGGRAQYGTASPVADGKGTIYFKNDSGYLMAVDSNNNTTKNIFSFEIEGYQADINHEQQKITLELPSGFNLKSCSPIVLVSKGAIVSPASGESVDFSSTRIYRVTAEDGSQKEYQVSVSTKSGTVDMIKEKEEAKASLAAALAKINRNDYTSENWEKIQEENIKGIAEIDGANTAQQVYDALNNTLQRMGKIEVLTNQRITICVAMEKFTLGQGYLIEPTLIQVPKYTKASTVILDLLKKKYPNVEKPYEFNGSEEEDFYLASVYDTNTNLNIPNYILTAIGGSVEPKANSNLLGEFDYSGMSGWRFSINNVFHSLSASAWRLSDKEVLRWQFSLAGFGTDLGSQYQNMPALKPVADKSALTWRVAEINGLYNKNTVLAAGTNRKKYEDAMSVLTKIDSTQDEVDHALSELNQLARPSDASSSGGGGGVGGSGYVDSNPKKELSFADVAEHHWARDSIATLTNKGIIKGKTETHFAPEDTITRAEFVSLLARISEESVVTYQGEFQDVKTEDWYAQSVAWAFSRGITKGVSTWEFGPNLPITRQDMAVLIVRFCDYLYFQLPKHKLAQDFADTNTISPYAQDAVSKMQQAGILSGKGENQFMPYHHATRAEAAKMLAMMMTEMK